MVETKVDGIIKTIYLDHIEEFYFKLSVPDGYRIKTTVATEIDSIYLTEAEVHELFKKLHIRTETILHKIFKIDFRKQLQIKRLTSYIHELGAVKEKFSKANATKEDLVNATVHLGRITKDSEIASLDFETIQQEELYNICHKKHYEYLTSFTVDILEEVSS